MPFKNSGQEMKRALSL